METIPEEFYIVLEDVVAVSEFGAVLCVHEAMYLQLLTQRHGFVFVHRNVDSLDIDQIHNQHIEVVVVEVKS